MPSILLINDNKIISRLLQLSSQKHDYELEEINDYTASTSAYNVIFIDSEKYDEDALSSLKESLSFDKLGYIGDKANPAPEGFDFVLEKPFLPTDFVKLMQENFRVVPPEEDDSQLDDLDDIDSEDELDLDELDDLKIEEDSELLDDLDELELDEESADVTSDVETTLTTGIAESMVQDDSKEELAEMVSEIDSMEEGELEEMDLDELVDESELDAMDEKASTDEGEESESEDITESKEVEEDPEAKDVTETKESEGESEETTESKEDEEESEVEDTTESKEDEEEPETKDETDIEEIKDEPLEDDKDEVEDSGETSTLAAGAVAAATAVAASAVASHSEEVEETLNVLDGIEAIEKEDDYLVENENKVEDLADEFDSLNEAEVKQLMSGEEEISDSSEEIISEEITSEGEEKVVESGDLEEMITRAVAKAITKEMLQEALNDMEIVVTLKSKGS